ncbi:hypothetical protein C8R47DRAFT_1079761 [Mycena vitilis]|nr:hypothetical protein C8R47DRAFT_1079761 [Mycena vitilis]
MSGPSHKRKTTKPTFAATGTASTVSSRSADKRRVRNQTRVVAQDAAPITVPLSRSFWEDDLPTNMARRAELFSYDLGVPSVESQEEDDSNDGITVVTWYADCHEEYLEENVRREGRGSPTTYASCAGSPAHPKCSGTPEWRCVDQACFGEVMHCKACIISIHARLPTHFVEQWDGTKFVRYRNGLQRLGLRVQLNHPPGVVCSFRRAADKDFVLYDLNGVHEINVDFCGCRTNGGHSPPVLPRLQLLRACWWPATTLGPNTCATFAVVKLFQIMSCLGKISAYDFLRALEKCTNGDGRDKPPDRRKPFMHIVRQWRETKRLKRHGRAHRRGGAKGTKRGELTLACRACPHPGWNLPDDWQNIAPMYRVSSEAADPIMGDGWGYFCKREGEDGYKAHIAKHVNEKEVSNCSGFQALFLANTKRSKGLRTTGIGGVTCSRHNMWRANGMGDLQVGERYCNMDFLLLGAIMHIYLLCLIISYDIACQYSIYFWGRVLGLPLEMRPKVGMDSVWWKVPNFHLPPHKPPCHAPYSFHYMFGAGMSHGEGVEQNWSLSNGAAGSTRLMGPGSRQSTLEDIFGFHNYDRLLAMHRILPKRLAVNIKQAMKHKAAFKTFTEGLEEFQPEQVQEWRDWVDRWESKQHKDPSESPFELVEEVTTLRDIQLELATEEFICTEDGVEVEREHTPSTFITMGLNIEDTQRRLEVDVKALKDPSPTQRLAFTKRRTALLKRIHKFRQVQSVYMPSVRGVLSPVQKQMFDGNGEQLPEVTRLFMPSEIEAGVRGSVCAIGLPSVEGRLREGEARGALEAIRHGLRTRTLTNRYKLRNWSGQGMMTKGQGILRQINIRIHIAKVQYLYARAALLEVAGHGDWEERLKVLTDDDVRALNERALTAEEKARNEHWAEIGGAIIKGGVDRGATVAGQGAHTLSWIWYSVGGEAVDKDERLLQALRVEWCNTCARTRRYDEEVRLLREEMRRTIASGFSVAREWEELGDGTDELPGATPELTEGRRAYAAEQVHAELERCAELEKSWRPILDRADAYLGGDVDLAMAGVVTVQLDEGDELDGEEEEARLEEEEGDFPEGP